MLFLLLLLYYIPLINSLSSQEDLTIPKYSLVGCLTLKSDKAFLAKNSQENFLLSYQTLSSAAMTIELCFRLCRRWIVLMFNHQQTCICLYTISTPYELNEYLGEFNPFKNCTSNSVEVYSLNNDSYVLPSLLSSTTDDWSLDGCYYLHGIQNIRVDLWLKLDDYVQAMDRCRTHCQKIADPNLFSYFLSRKKACYCLPVKLSQAIKTVALRKPLVHCSFLPYICQAFANSCEKITLGTNADTLVKIDIHHYCSSSTYSSFVFERRFYMCFKSVSMSTQMTFSTIIYDGKCLPLVIRTHQQWTDLIQSSWITYSKLYVWIDPSSVYLFKDLFNLNNQTLFRSDLCIQMLRIDSNQVSYELIQCAEAEAPGYVLCAQKPLPQSTPSEEEFKMISTGSEVSDDEIFSCPPEFILFDKTCYYIHPSFKYDIRSSERTCNQQYATSTLVKLESHEWGNTNATSLRGRTLVDILLELFYYLIEKKASHQSINQPNTKHWLRLLLGDKDDAEKCVLRYFTRSSGAFTILHQCNDGGHPVCQCEPSRTKIIPVTETISVANASLVERKIEPITVTSTTQVILSNTTELFIALNETIMSGCENCTTTTPLADEDLTNNETRIDSFQTTNQTSQHAYRRYRPLIVILTGPVLGLIILFIGIGLLIRYLRRNHGTYSICIDGVGSRRMKRSSTTLTTSDLPNTPAVLYTRLKPPRLAETDTDMLLPLDNSVSIDDNIELLPATKIRVINDSIAVREDDQEEPFYATLK